MAAYGPDLDEGLPMRSVRAPSSPPPPWPRTSWPHRREFAL